MIPAMALAILVTGVWREDTVGVTLTSLAYEQAFPDFGSWLILLMVVVLGNTTVLGYSCYGGKCMAFLFGTRREKHYVWAYAALIVAGAAGAGRRQPVSVPPAESRKRYPRPRRKPIHRLRKQNSG